MHAAGLRGGGEGFSFTSRALDPVTAKEDPLPVLAQAVILGVAVSHIPLELWALVPCEAYVI